MFDRTFGFDFEHGHGELIQCFWESKKGKKVDIKVHEPHSDYYYYKLHGAQTSSA
jgi:hypothetical protein